MATKNSPFTPDTGASAYAQGLVNKTKPPVNRADVDTILKEYNLTGFKAKDRSDQDLRGQAVKSVIQWWKNQQKAQGAAKAAAGSEAKAAVASNAGGSFSSAPAPSGSPRIVSRETLARRAAAAGTPTTPRNVSAATLAKRRAAQTASQPTTNRSAPSTTTGGTPIQRPSGRGFTQYGSVALASPVRRVAPRLRGGLLRF